MVNKDELASNGVVVDGVEISNDERQACEVWTRVMGYYRPVAFFNTRSPSSTPARRASITSASSSWSPTCAATT